MPAAEITDAELMNMALALELSREYLNTAQGKELLRYLAGVYDETFIAANETLYGALVDQLTRAGNAQAQQAARDMAHREASTLAKNLLETELRSIGETIARGIEAGKHPFEIAKDLDEVKGLDSGRAASYMKYSDYLDNLDPPLSKEDYERRLESEYQRLLKDRKETIAQTEQRYATSKANALEALDRGDQYKSWITVGDANVSEECQANEAEGWIDIEDEFSSGASEPPEHPNCRCTVAYRRAEPDEDAQARADARAEQTANSKAGDNAEE